MFKYVMLCVSMLCTAHVVYGGESLAKENAALRAQNRKLEFQLSLSQHQRDFEKAMSEIAKSNLDPSTRVMLTGGLVAMEGMFLLAAWRLSSHSGLIS